MGGSFGESHTVLRGVHETRFGMSGNLRRHPAMPLRSHGGENFFHACDGGAEKELPVKLHVEASVLAPVT